MNLLPRTKDQFRCSSYWDEFFKKRKKAFDWYGDYNQLCDILHKYVKTGNKVLVVGCGSSTLSGDMYDVGYHDITNIDTSEVIIRQMSDKNSQHRPAMKWIQMDVRKMSFGDDVFNAVIDKGTLDALLPDDSDDVRVDVNTMFSEVSRVLGVAGRYVCVTLLQEHVLHTLLAFFTQLCWHIRIHKVLMDTTDNTTSHLPVFVVVCTKFKKTPAITSSILEVAHFADTVRRCEDLTEMVTFVKEVQYYAMVLRQLSQKLVHDNQLSVQLYDTSDQPRYTLHIVDREAKPQKPFAIFIVPKGREVEWMFSTDEGRLNLAESASFSRLVVVTLNPTHLYKDLDSVKAELSTKVMELAPRDIDPSVQVPFLSLGDDIGRQAIVKRGKSELSGEYIVEDVEIEGETFRRLVFLNNPHVVQSDARLILATSRRRSRERTVSLGVDPGYIPNTDYLLSMVGGLALIHDSCSRIEGDLHVLLIGLGGGTLPRFLHHYFPRVYMTAVEIDSEMLSVAKEFFELPKTDMVSVILDDGLNVINTAVKNGKQYDAVILDVDNKDMTLGMSAPPLAFVQTHVLSAIRSLIPKGVLLLNLSCRDKLARESVLATVKREFSRVFVTSSGQDVNEVVYAVDCDCRVCTAATRDDVTECLHRMNKIAKSSAENSRFDVTGMLRQLETV